MFKLSSILFDVELSHLQLQGGGYMPRQPRRIAVGYPHHVTQRGNNREPVFLDNSDYLKYLSLLTEYSEKYELDIWSYCLMPNHVHFLVVPHTVEGLSRGIGTTNMLYTQYFNKRYQRSGRIWQNRFFSCIVSNNDYLWNVTRYIENNPVKSGLAECAWEYEWTSAKAHCYGETDEILNGPGWLQDEMKQVYREYLNGTDRLIEEQIRVATSTG